MPRRPIKLGFRHHSAVWFERARDVKHRRTRFIGPRLDQAKLFDRLFVMSGDWRELEPRAAKTEIMKRPEMRSDWGQWHIPFNERHYNIGRTGQSDFQVSQQSIMHAGFSTSGRESPTNIFRFGILIALSVLASRVASAGNKPFRWRI
jgi:hypothetical protein